MLALLVAPVFLTGAVGRAPRGRSPLPVAEADFADYLSDRPLAVDGVLVTAVPAQTRIARRDGSVSGALESWRFTVRINRVLVGACPDSLLLFQTGMRSTYADAPEGQPPASGSHVLAWINNTATPDRIPLGNLAVVGVDGGMAGELSSAATWGRGPGGQPYRYSALLDTLRERSRGDSHRSFEGAQAVALVRVIQIGRTVEGQESCTLDSLGWWFGTASRMPRVLLSIPRASCRKAVRAGDSLLVPLREPAPADTIRLVGCIGALRIDRGYLAGFATPLGRLASVLDTTGGVLRLRAAKSGAR